ncbi:hypothetical protein CPB84DRAFT_1788510 [Gymnopilus junonius]|uniref:Uncharacterized protein n=1 Tax=Gymnopilus junonius TaxID=109634 RepID=A0A9P5NEA6_GYMJU|nr:hypothetical protein CPB84DRAFT_1788510 [Gymnopilus junonius]
MANLLRTAKSGNDWTTQELEAYNITIVSQSKADFFGTTELADPTDPSLLGFINNESRATASDNETKQLIHYLDLAMNPKVGQEAAVDNFAAELLKSLKYNRNGKIVFIRHTLPFVICGENSIAQTDVCVMNNNDILLMLLHDDKRLTSLKDPEPQVIAEAIAAFALNNRKLVRNLNIPSPDAILIPAIIMAGTTPIFYKIIVTTELSRAVQNGTYPNTETRVLRYIPTLPTGRNNDGMRPLQNRLEILRCLEAFRQFLGK